MSVCHSNTTLSVINSQCTVYSRTHRAYFLTTRVQRTSSGRIYFRICNSGASWVCQSNNSTIGNRAFRANFLPVRVQRTSISCVQCVVYFTCAVWLYCLYSSYGALWADFLSMGILRTSSSIQSSIWFVLAVSWDDFCCGHRAYRTDLFATREFFTACSVQVLWPFLSTGPCDMFCRTNRAFTDWAYFFAMRILKTSISL